MRQNPCLWLIIVFPYYMTCNRNIFHHQTSGSNISSVEETCDVSGQSIFSSSHKDRISFDYGKPAVTVLGNVKSPLYDSRTCSNLQVASDEFDMEDGDWNRISSSHQKPENSY